MKPLDEFQVINSSVGTQIPIAFYPADKAKVTLLMLPAMGVRASFYRHFAKYMSENGIAVYLMEQRGHGHSTYRASRQHDFACVDYIEEDIKTAISWIKSKCVPETPFYLGGHSMGGHMAVSYAGLFPDDIDGLLTIACGLPHPDVFDGKVGRRITSLARLLPFILFLWGYFPGERIGFAGREFKSYMKDWLVMVQTGNYDFKNVSANIEAGIRNFTKPVHIFSVEADDFAPIKSVGAIGDKFVNADVARPHLTAADLDGCIGHFDWVKGMKTAAPKVAAALINKK
jgi:predicted alpha/beta hydrolase